MGVMENLPTVRATREQIQDLLDALDAAACPIQRDVRRSRRTSYRSLSVVVDVMNARGGSTCQFKVATRNITAGGLAFLHKQMLSIDTKLRILIPTLDESRLEVHARVTRCRHVKGMIHEIGVEFLHTGRN